MTNEDIKVLVACEFSGTVRDAFLDLGFDAWSCDLLPDDRRSNRHIQDDARNVLASEEWDLLMVAHPPCTRLCNSGVRWLHEPPPGKTNADMIAELMEGASLFSDLWNADVPHIAIENPVMHKYAKALIRNYQKPTCTVQPWQHGHGETKATCFWTRDLPPLEPTNIVEGREQRVHRMSPGPDRWRERSRFFPGIAKAIARQWGGHAFKHRIASRLAGAA